MGRDSLDIQDQEGEAAAAARYENVVTLQPKKEAATKLGRHESADKVLPPTKGESIQVPPGDVPPPDADDLRRAKMVLFWALPDDPDIWGRVGMALKDAFGEHGRVLWDDWSEGNEYDAKEQEAKWQSFKKSGTGLGALLQIAKEEYDYEPYEPPSSDRKKAEQKEAADDEPEEKANADAKGQGGKQPSKFQADSLGRHRAGPGG